MCQLTKYCSKVHRTNVHSLTPSLPKRPVDVKWGQTEYVDSPLRNSQIIVRVQTVKPEDYIFQATLFFLLFFVPITCNYPWKVHVFFSFSFGRWRGQLFSICFFIKSEAHIRGKKSRALFFKFILRPLAVFEQSWKMGYNLTQGIYMYGTCAPLVWVLCNFKHFFNASLQHFSTFWRTNKN